MSEATEIIERLAAGFEPGECCGDCKKQIDDGARVELGGRAVEHHLDIEHKGGKAGEVIYKHVGTRYLFRGEKMVIADSSEDHRSGSEILDFRVAAASLIGRAVA